MYYAQMYDYGTDQNHVGITGMAGCMGAVFAAPNHLYAIHIPNMVLSNPIGAAHFVAMVQNLEGVPNPAGTLHVFTNGLLRSTADDEARTMHDGLGAPETKVYRLMTGLNPAVVGADPLAATIRVLAIFGGLHLSYKHVPDDQWIAGGNARTGRYLGTLADAPTRPNAGQLLGGWSLVNQATCHIRRVH
jgi:hypothetical protein